MIAQSFRTEAFQVGLDDHHNFSAYDMIDILWNSRGILLDDVIQRSFIVMETNDFDTYYLGDQPVVFQNTEDPKNNRSLGFASTGIEAFMPLTPTLALYLPCSTTTDYIVNGYTRARNTLLGRANGLTLGSGPSPFNELMLKQARKVIISSQKIYDAIVLGEKLNAEPLNVENLNYLQCVYASSIIMSSSKNFSLADKIFSENPQYREPPKVRLFGAGGHIAS